MAREPIEYCHVDKDGDVICTGRVHPDDRVELLDGAIVCDHCGGSICSNCGRGILQCSRPIDVEGPRCVELRGKADA